MNTVQKGNDFEKLALEFIEKLQEEEVFASNKHKVQIIPKKKYHSTQRKAPINVDIAIEVYHNNSEKPTLLYIIECKNYRSRVPASKVEAFINQLNQINAHKGIFITNMKLQKSAMEVCLSNKIMVIEQGANKEFVIQHHKEEAFKKPNLNPNTIENFNSKLDKSLFKIISEVFNYSKSNEKTNIEKLSKEHIKDFATEVLAEIEPNYKRVPITEKKLIDYINHELKYKVKDFTNLQSNIVGYCNFEENEIGINENLIQRNRRLFIIAHEVGHLLLHSNVRINKDFFDLLEDSKLNFMIGKHSLENDKNWVEWQANYFAENLILNQDVFVYKLEKIMTYLSYPMKKIVVNDHRESAKNFSTLLKKLSDEFNVSQTSIYYRLKSLKILIDDRNIKSIGEIFYDELNHIF